MAGARGAAAPVQIPQKARRRVARGSGGWALLAGLVVALRLPTLWMPARPDEAGYLLVAQHLHRGGPFLYGPLFVDRPPLLIAVFRVADALGGLPALRVIGVAAALLLVLACASAGQAVGGRRGWWAAGLVAAALQATPLLGAPEVDGELLGTPLVALAFAVGLHAVRDPDRRRATAGTAVAGALAGSALLVKQNLGDAAVLLAALLVCLLVQRQLRPRRGVLLLAVLAVATAVPLLLALLWSTAWGPGVGVAWHDLVGFRTASLHVLDARPSPARDERSEALAQAVVLSGVAPLAAGALLVRRYAPRRPGPSLPTAALLAVLATGAAGTVLGGSYWQHYLLQLVPASALAVGIVAAAAPLRVTAAVVALVAASSLVAGGSTLSSPGPCTDGRGAQQVSRWLAARAQPGDSGATLYGGADVLLGTGLRLVYPYLWSLPVRTLDPRLEQLTAAVTGPHRLDWLVVSTPVDAWGLDPAGRLSAQLSSSYTPVATVCGRQVLHRAPSASR